MSTALRELTTVAQLIPHFLASREARGLRPLTQLNYRIFGAWMSQHWGTRAVRQVTDEDIIGLVKTKSRNHAQMARTLFKWLVEVKVLPRDFDLGTMPTPRRSEEHEVQYLSPAQTRKLLRLLRPNFRAGFALGLYAGLRPFEALRMRWEDIQIQSRRIRVPAHVSKIRRPRMIERVPPILWALLRPLAKRTGRVMPGADEQSALYLYMAERQRLRRLGVELTHDVLRHTFATHFSALTGDATLCARVLGHYKLLTLIAHYDGVATRAQAKDYFASNKRKRRAPR